MFSFLVSRQLKFHGKGREGLKEGREEKKGGRKGRRKEKKGRGEKNFFVLILCVQGGGEFVERGFTPGNRQTGTTSPLR